MKVLAKKTLVGLVVVALLAGAGLTIAVANWSHTYSWNKVTEVQDFSVYTDEGLTQVFSSGGSTVITDFTQPYQETFYIKNTGNVEITVTASATISGASVSWTPSNSVTIAAGASASLALTINDYQDGDGSCVVNFSMS